MTRESLTNTVPGCPHPPCQCDMQARVCVCSPTEKALRAWVNGVIPDMDAEQRAWCLREIEAVEGFTEDDHEGLGSAGLARAVLHAWAEIARDKGLLP